MEYVPDAKNKFRGMQQVKSYCKTTGTEFVSEKISSDNLKGWNIYCFPNRFKVFLFKYYNNILGTANRVAHFNQDTDPACLFCKINLNLPAPVESFAHLFFDCPHVYNVIEKFYAKYLNFEINRANYFSGAHTELTIENQSINLVLNVLRFNIWETKLLRKNISFPTLENETINMLQYITDSSQKLKTRILMSAFINVDGEGGRGQQPVPGGP